MKHTGKNLLQQQCRHLFFICSIVTVPKRGINKRGLFLCDCGKLAAVYINKVLCGHTKSCGKCSTIPKEKIATMKFGCLTVVNPKDMSCGSEEKILCNCDCGRQSYVTAFSLFRPNKGTKSCGKCNEIPREVMTIKKFGCLRQTVPKNTALGSHEKDNFICDCGGNINVVTKDVLCGKTKTCGRCDLIVKQWYQQNQAELKKLKCPIKCGHILGGPIEAKEIIEKMIKPFKATCPACKKDYKPRLSAIKRGCSLTCGCISHRVSSPVVQIAEFIKLFGFETEFEYKIDGLFYDVFVKYKNNEGLLIEYDGNHWHDGSEESVKMEAKKEKHAINSGYEFLRIKETDWKKANMEKTKKQLMSLLNVDKHENRIV
jgi:hypothetical protein